MKLILYMQDVKKGNIRYIANTFPSYGYLWNYGAMPQTWEDPDHVDSSTKYQGDSDPVDILGQFIYSVTKICDVFLSLICYFFVVVLYFSNQSLVSIDQK